MVCDLLENSFNYIAVAELKEVAWRGDSTATTMAHAEGDGHIYFARVNPETGGSFCTYSPVFMRNTDSVVSFLVERGVMISNTSILEGRVRSLDGSLKFRGNITVPFPVSHTAVVVAAGSQGAGFVTKPFSKIPDKEEYSVVRAIWPSATTASSSLATAMNGQGGTARVCALQSNEGWWDV